MASIRRDCLTTRVTISLNQSTPSNQSTPTNRALTAQQRERLRARLESDLEDGHEQQDRLRALIDATTESRRGVGTDESEDPEGGSLAFEKAQASSLLERSIRHSLEISHALGKLDADSYGTCEDCGQFIPYARLDARPSAALCIRCAS